MGSLAVVIVVDVLSCSRTLSTARFHNCRLRDGIPLGFPVAEGLASNDGDSFLDITGERARKHLMNDRNQTRRKISNYIFDSIDVLYGADHYQSLINFRDKFRENR